MGTRTLIQEFGPNSLEIGDFGSELEAPGTGFWAHKPLVTYNDIHPVNHRMSSSHTSSVTPKSPSTPTPHLQQSVIHPPYRTPHLSKITHIITYTIPHTTDTQDITATACMYTHNTVTHNKHTTPKAWHLSNCLAHNTQIKCTGLWQHSDSLANSLVAPCGFQHSK